MPASRRNAQRALKSLAGADAKDSDLPRNLTFYKGRWHIENPRNWEEDHLPIAVALRATRVIKTQQTDWQMMTMLDGPCGKTLLLDEVIQITSWDWQYYNECLTHVALCASIDAPKHVLIIGGGDGACLHEAVRYDSVERVDMVDIDGQVVDLCREEFDFARLAFDHPKANVIIGDGCAFIDAEKGSIAPATYEAAIIDCTDCDQEDMPSDSLYSPAFYANLMRVIKPGGVLTIQADGGTLERCAKVLKALRAAGFADAQPLIMQTPTYLGGYLYAVAARRPASEPGQLFDPVFTPARPLAGVTQAFTPSRYTASFDLPPRTVRELAAELAKAE
jgi:spermidine synthase